jgi:hypothetical protein
MDDLFSSLLLLIVFAVFYVPFVWWLYTINKKLGEKNPWLAFFPILQFYSIIKASWKSLWWILWTILISLWISIVLAVILFVIYSIFFMQLMYGWWMQILDLFAEHIILSSILLILIYVLIIWLINTWYIIILHWISKRTNRWFWTTLWLFYIPFIMFPIIAYKLKDQSDLLKSNDLEKEKQETIEL